jgi:hypothetical protein
MRFYRNIEDLPGYAGVGLSQDAMPPGDAVPMVSVSGQSGSPDRLAFGKAKTTIKIAAIQSSAFFILTPCYRRGGS